MAQNGLPFLVTLLLRLAKFTNIQVQAGIRVPTVFFVNSLKNSVVYEEITQLDGQRALSSKEFLDKLQKSQCDLNVVRLFIIIDAFNLLSGSSFNCKLWSPIRQNTPQNAPNQYCTWRFDHFQFSHFGNFDNFILKFKFIIRLMFLSDWLLSILDCHNSQARQKIKLLTCTC